MLNRSRICAKAAISLGAVLVGVSLFNVTASAQFRRSGIGVGSNSVIVYADPDFRGASQALGETPDLRRYGLNDKISSIEIPPGEVWEVCQDANFQSRCQNLTSSVADLRGIGWDDRISSLRRIDGFGNGGYRNGNGGIFSRRQEGLVFYDRTGFRGNTTVVTNDVYNQGSLGNRRARSVEVRGGGAWQLCDRSGRCTTINQSVSDLAQIGLNGQITSVRPVSNLGYGRDPRDRDYSRDRDYRRDRDYGYGDPRQENNKR